MSSFSESQAPSEPTTNADTEALYPRLVNQSDRGVFLQTFLHYTLVSIWFEKVRYSRTTPNSPSTKTMKDQVPRPSTKTSQVQAVSDDFKGMITSTMCRTLSVSFINTRSGRRGMQLHLLTIFLHRSTVY